MSTAITELFGTNVFSVSVMRERLPKKVFAEVTNVMENGGSISMSTADVVANAMKNWALEKGATHYTHWFQPLTGITAEKHDSFLTAPVEGKTLLQLSGKQLILTSDKPPVELKDIEQRLLTRFKWGLSAQLNTPDYDTKLKIIRAKAQKLGAQITDDVVAYLADNISANVREIEGALSSLVANASFLGRKITTSLAKEILKVYVKLYQKEITIDHIIEVVCEYLNLDFARFNSTERTREIAQARQIAMYLAKQHTKAPLTTIGSAIGGRNHATVLHSCKAVTNLIETDKAFRRQVEEIEKKVLAQ